MVQATCLDAERKFLEASMKYLELAQLSSAPEMNVDEDSILKSLENSVFFLLLR